MDVIERTYKFLYSFVKSLRRNVKMENKKEDRRIRHTKERLRNALVDLLKKENINKLTVTKICNKADVNRGTFYSYFSDVYDLLEYTENEMFESVIKLYRVSVESGELKKMYTDIFKGIENNIDITRALFGENIEGRYLKKIINRLHDGQIKKWKADFPELDSAVLETMYNFVVMGTINAVTEWVHSDNRMPPEKFAEVLVGLNKGCRLAAENAEKKETFKNKKSL